MARPTRKQVAGAGAIALVTGSLVAFIHTREDVKYKPYRDVLGIWTVCGGITGKHVIPGKVYSKEECEALDAGAIEAHGRGLMECVKVPITQNQYEALASWTFNVGVGGACKSTLLRKLNDGEPPAVWCAELRNWNKGGGRVIRGLTNRRKAEEELCRKDG